MNYKSLIASFAIVSMMVAGVAFTGCLDDGGDEENTVYWLEVAPINQKALLAAGEIDGAITWEPYASDAYLDGTAQIFAWSEDIWPNHPCCVVAVDDDFLEDNEDVVLQFLKAHIVANEWIDETIANPSDDPDSNYTLLLNMGAEFSQRNTTVVESSLNHMDLKYEMDQEWIDYLENITEKYEEQDLFTQTMQEAGYDDIPDFIDTFVNESLIDRAQDVEPVEDWETNYTEVRVGYLVGDLHQFARVVASNVTVGERMFGESKSIFAAYGIKDVISEGGPYANGGYEMGAFGTGSIDIGYLGSPPAMLKHINEEIGITIISQVNSVGSAIFVSDEIDSIEDFEGKTIATPGPASIQHLMFLDYMTENGYTVKAA